MITMWGYTLPELNTLPDMMTVNQYKTFTGRNSDGDERVAAEISAACAAIRNYAGWHLGPSEVCRVSTTIADRRVTCIGNDILIQLPAKAVTEVASVTIGGTEYADFDIDQVGLLRVYNVGIVERYSKVIVDYTAGLPDDMLAPVIDLIAHRVMHAHAVAPGITSEASGGVSVTYNAGWVNSTRATALNDVERELLVPYKVQGVF